MTRPAAAGRQRGRPASIPPHKFDPLPDEPADWHGRRWCTGPQGCGRLGKDGDAQHPNGAPSLTAARLAAVPASVHEADAAIRRRFDPGDADD